MFIRRRFLIVSGTVLLGLISYLIVGPLFTRPKVSIGELIDNCLRMVELMQTEVAMEKRMWIDFVNDKVRKKMSAAEDRWTVICVYKQGLQLIGMSQNTIEMSALDAVSMLNAIKARLLYEKNEDAMSGEKAKSYYTGAIGYFNVSIKYVMNKLKKTIHEGLEVFEKNTTSCTFSDDVWRDEENTKKLKLAFLK